MGLRSSTLSASNSVGQRSSSFQSMDAYSRPTEGSPRSDANIQFVPGYERAYTDDVNTGQN